MVMQTNNTPIIDTANTVATALMVSHVRGREEHNQEIKNVLLAAGAHQYGDGLLDLRLVVDSHLTRMALDLHDLPPFMDFYTTDVPEQDANPYVFDHDKVVTITTDIVTAGLIITAVKAAGIAMTPLRPDYQNTMIDIDGKTDGTRNRFDRQWNLAEAGLHAYRDDDNGITVSMDFGNLHEVDAEDIAYVMVQPTAKCREIENPCDADLLAAVNELADERGERVITMAITPQLRCFTETKGTSETGMRENSIHDVAICHGVAGFYNTRFVHNITAERQQYIISNNCDPLDTMPPI